MASVTDAAGTRNFTYNASFDRIAETINGIYSKVLSYNHETSEMKGRYLGFSLDNVVNSNYNYDSYGRLSQISNGAGAFAYTRLAGSELIENLTRPNGVNTAWSYEATATTTAMKSRERVPTSTAFTATAIASTPSVTA